MMPYEVWVVIDNDNPITDECIVAVFTDEQELLKFTQTAEPFFKTNRFRVQAKVSVNPGAVENKSVRVEPKEKKYKKGECQCEFCVKCKVCGHRADEHVAGEGSCYMKDCPCQSFDDNWNQKDMLENFSSGFDEEGVD
jgi:hypothetical protein